MEEANFKGGRCSAEERKERIDRYKAKRTQRNFNKTIEYLSPEDMDQNSLLGTTNANCRSEQCTTRQSSILEHTEVHNDPIVDEFERRLAVGQSVTNPEDAYLLYCEYGRAKGFSVRKGKQEYFHDNSGELYMKEFTCSCKGTKDDKRSAKGKQPIYQKMELRTGCMARLRLGRKKNEEWRVIVCDIEHNHDMAAAGQRSMLRSARNISYAKGDTLKALVDAGLSVANTSSYMQQEPHGSENVSFLQKDAHNYLNRLMKDHRQVEDGDIVELIRYFQNKSNEDVLFYWDFQVDVNNRMRNFFFRDGRCRSDYEAFGDVLSVDTSFRTNEYNLLCAFFIGINHHMHNVMFGLAFIYDETEASFLWLFNTFLESMGGKQPETVFTDHCQAMMNAVETVFPYSHHRLCQWHINQNAPSHFGSLYNDSGFKSLLSKCMESCESREEFEDVWSRMIAGYNLYDHSWLSSMYKLRHKWSTAFSKHRFSAGLKATLLSEGTNSTLKDDGERTHTLFECVQRFERVQNMWRQDEKKDDFTCRHEMPTLAVINNLLLRDAAAIYTHTIFNMFQSELINSLGIDFDGQPSYTGTLSVFKVRSQGDSNQDQKVEFDMEAHEIKCTCQYFEAVGILCKHALLVFKRMNVHKIPTRYIKLRWTKTVRDRVNCGDEIICASDHESETFYVNQIRRVCYDLIMRSEVHPEARNLVKNGLKGVVSTLNVLLDNMSLNELTVCRDDVELEGSNVEILDVIEENNSIDDEHVNDPPHVTSSEVSNDDLMPLLAEKQKRKRKS